MAPHHNKIFIVAMFLFATLYMNLTTDITLNTYRNSIICLSFKQNIPIFGKTLLSPSNFLCNISSMVNHIYTVIRIYLFCLQLIKYDYKYKCYIASGMDL